MRARRVATRRISRRPSSGLVASAGVWGTCWVASPISWCSRSPGRRRPRGRTSGGSRSSIRGLTEDRWIKAVEVRPTLAGRRIVHHGNSALAEFAVGKAGEIYPDDTGRLMKAGEKVGFDIHYHSVGEEITDYLSIGVWFYPKGVVPKYEVKHSVMGVFQSMDTFDLPPHTVTKHHAFIPLATATRILSYQPHMHLRGKSMSMEAIYPNGRVEMLSHVENFNFNWTSTTSTPTMRRRCCRRGR